MKTFEVPQNYTSSFISAIKKKRARADKLKKDFTPTLLDFGSVQIYLSRHFGFCYGVENAIEIAFRTIKNNPNRNIFLLSQMIHNPMVNRDLEALGVRFLQDANGNNLIPFDTLKSEDIVLIPAFGTTTIIEKKMLDLGIDIEKYNTTCPFVEKVWNRSTQIAQKGFTVIIHGKPSHEETRATFSHTSRHTPTLVVKDMEEAVLLGKYIVGEKKMQNFFIDFDHRFSKNFDPHNDLQKIGVVNQTTMLASETQAIASYLKQKIVERDRYKQNTSDHFADNRDTLCYATNDNQSAVYGLLKTKAHLAIVVGGYNSSNTSHLVELCEPQLPTFFIENADKILSSTEILHFNIYEHQELIVRNYLPSTQPLKVLLTAGASCPDILVEEVIHRILQFYPTATDAKEVIGRI